MLSMMVFVGIVVAFSSLTQQSMLRFSKLLFAGAFNTCLKQTTSMTFMCGCADMILHFIRYLFYTSMRHFPHNQRKQIELHEIKLNDFIPMHWTAAGFQLISGSKMKIRYWPAALWCAAIKQTMRSLCVGINFISRNSSSKSPQIAINTKLIAK